MEASVPDETGKDEPGDEAKVTQEPAKPSGQQDEWLRQGSEYIGQRIRRVVYNDSSKPFTADGTVVGWLPVELADFISEHTNEAAALWHIHFDDDTIGEEDLEEFEVKDAIDLFTESQKDDSPSKSKSAKKAVIAKKGKTDRKEKSDEAPKRQKRKQDVGQGLPKKPQSAFMIWSSSIRQKVKDENPDLDFAGLSSHCSKLWRELPADEKQEWNKKYLKAVQDWTDMESQISAGDARGFKLSPDLSEVDSKSINESEGSECSRSEKAKSKARPAPAADDCFVIVVNEDWESQRGFRLYEICTTVSLEGGCKAREWYSSADLGECELGQQKFLPSQSSSKSFQLRPNAFHPVSTLRGRQMRKEYVQIVNEQEMVSEAYRVLRGEKSAHSFEELVVRSSGEEGCSRTPGKATKEKGSRNSTPVSKGSQEKSVCSDEEGELGTSRGSRRKQTVGTSESREGEEESLQPAKRVRRSLEGNGSLESILERDSRRAGNAKPSSPSQTQDGAATQQTITPEELLRREEEKRIRHVGQLKRLRKGLRELMAKESCSPLMLRLAWHDAATYRTDGGEWPKCGGANGSITFGPELDLACNKGLSLALSLLYDLKEENDLVSDADLIQMAGQVAVEFSGGPKIPMRWGRRDVDGPEACADPEASQDLERGTPPFVSSLSPSQHLRQMFGRMGFTDQELVVLMGAHTLGRARPWRSGEGAASTSYTREGPGRCKGGTSWTKEWLKFDNSYFKNLVDPQNPADPQLLRLSTDAALVEDPSLREWAERYAEDQELFFTDYARTHRKMSELGAKFEPEQGVELDFEEE